MCSKKYQLISYYWADAVPCRADIAVKNTEKTSCSHRTLHPSKGGNKINMVLCFWLWSKVKVEINGIWCLTFK